MDSKLVQEYQKSMNFELFDSINFVESHENSSILIKNYIEFLEGKLIKIRNKEDENNGGWN